MKVLGFLVLATGTAIAIILLDSAPFWAVTIGLAGLIGGGYLMGQD